MKDLFLRPVDAPKVALATLAAAALFGLTLFAADRVPYRTKHVRDSSLPYTFSYPADFKKAGPSDLPADVRAGLEWPTGISKEDKGAIVVGAFVPAGRVQVVSAFRVQYEQYGARITSQKDVRYAGVDGVELEADSSEGSEHDRRTILFVEPRLAFSIQCIGRGGGKDDTDTACDKVLETFEITDPSIAPGGSPRVPSFGTPS
jgi:hypothetical protein